MPTARKFHVTALLSVSVVAGFALSQSCSTSSLGRSANLTLEPKDPEAARRAGIEDQLRTIAKEYPGYSRVSAKLQWSPMMCRTPVVPSVKLSDAPDASPHGRKLYFLYAKDAAAYHDMSRHGLDKRTFEPVESPAPMTNPVGQAVVKEAFAPVPAELERPRYEELRRAFMNNPPSIAVETKALERYAEDDHAKLVRAGDLSALFVMLKLDPSTPGTDQGWIYATIAPDRTTITSKGVIESCMNCHKQTNRDRLYGDNDFWPKSWPGAATKKPDATPTALAQQPTRGEPFAESPDYLPTNRALDTDPVCAILRPTILNT